MASRPHRLEEQRTALAAIAEARHDVIRRMICRIEIDDGQIEIVFL
jgi:hypothetical protein